MAHGNSFLRPARLAVVLTPTALRLRARNGAGSTIRTPALRQQETPPKRVPFRRVFRYYFAAVPCGPAYHGSVWWINPRGSLLRAPGPNDASFGRNAKSREIFLGSKPRKNLYMVANPIAPGRPGARALRVGGGHSRHLRPAAERGTSRRISCPPAGEHAPPESWLQSQVFPPLREPPRIAGRPFWRLGLGPGVVRRLVWETGGRPGL
jgi:hypothetical protein